MISGYMQKIKLNSLIYLFMKDGEKKFGQHKILKKPGMAIIKEENLRKVYILTLSLQDVKRQTIHLTLQEI